jgi:hypothetical protein
MRKYCYHEKKRSFDFDGFKQALEYEKKMLMPSKHTCVSVASVRTVERILFIFGILTFLL